MKSRLNEREWRELRERVMLRDLRFTFHQQHQILSWHTWRTKGSPCVAPVLDPSGSGRCSGRLTLDHVRDHPMMGKKAPDDEKHLVTLCEGHHLELRAGRNWATSHRPLLRDYLTTHYPDMEDTHAEQVP